ncbi:MAG TPA: MdtA/MuxA family multidrug efflux RND transporter periplasmic adaptor subunit [Stellaceae bacterium]|nr:MdtA/MuxA family multidrug efflux RND transporter periplasmic adaptor subunit [Stellaceae bacterium]
MDDQPPRPYVPPPSAPPPPPSPPGSVEARAPAPAPEYRPTGLDDAAPPRRGRLRRMLLWLVLAALVAGAVWYATRGHQTAPTGRFTSTGPMPVGTATVEKGDMPVIVNALGTVTPLAMVTMRTQIAGQLTEVAFKEGQMVSKGDFLAQVDPRPYQAALAQAEGQLAKDKAALAGAEVDLARYEKLVAQNSIARQQLDTQRATVAQNRGTVQADQAQVDTQKLNLVYAHIVAPVSGRVGLRQVDPGNYVQTSDTNGIVVITQLQPISVIFTLPEDGLQAVLKQVHAGKTLQAVAFDRTGATEIETGQLATIDNQIDTTTGTVKLRATFANAAFDLFPNQFVNIKLRVDVLQNASIVPSSAIQRGAPGTFVYLVKPDNTVTAQAVTLGPNEGEKVAVVKGLDPGQIIVTDGADRLKEGAKVQVTEGGAQPAGQAPGQPGQRRGQGQGERQQRRGGG